MSDDTTAPVSGPTDNAGRPIDAEGNLLPNNQPDTIIQGDQNKLADSLAYTPEQQAQGIGQTEGQIELAAGEIPGDRVGDVPVDGAAQTRTGTGELLPAPVAADPAPIPITVNHPVTGLQYDVSPSIARRLKEFFEKIVAEVEDAL